MTAAPERSSGGGGTQADAVARLFLASSRNIPVRLATAAVIALASLPLLSWRLGVAWLCLIGLITLFELWHVRSIREGRPLAVFEGIPLPTVTVAVASGVSYTVFMGLFWLTGDPIARAFAMAQTCISVLYILLQYYARPKVFLIAVSPYLVGAAVAMGAAAVEAVRSGRPWTILTAAAVVGLLCNLFWVARRQLAASRDALRKARAEAQERGVAAEAANEAKSVFLATMSHEIRTPLNGVLGMAQAMAADELAAPQRERLAVIRQSGESLLTILNDILDLAKIEAGRLELESVEFDLGELIGGAHSAFSGIAARKGLVLELSVERSASGLYVGDPTRVRQILFNLISNALKFTEAGQVSVVAARQGDALVLTVADSGVGIPAARLGQLFEKFTQADASTTRRFGGTGLGLSICRELAELMGGEVGAESVEGRGSNFVLRLPLPRRGAGAEGADGEVALAEAAGEAPGGTLRVLAAEDNAVNQLVLKSLLAQIGIEPVVVGTGVEAFDAWAASAWDLILMDMHMPVMDGLAAARRIREAEAASGRPRTPIVALSADAMSHQVEECLAAGMDRHVAKPIESARLFAAIKAALEAPPKAAAALSA